MNEFIIKNIQNDIEHELERIGFDKTYLKKAAEKFKYKNIKIYALSIPQANILKQTAISVGADCAVHRETITAKVEKTDCLLGGSIAQLRKIAEKLKKQPFSLTKLAKVIEEDIGFKLEPMVIKNTIFDFKRPYIVGVVNITENSFSDGNQFLNEEKATNHALKLLDEGADIIELGAESTKPGSHSIDDQTQLSRLIPVINALRKTAPSAIISIDTRSANVAKKGIEAGANIINDVSGFDFDKKMAQTIAKLNVPVLIQHSLSTPDRMQKNPTYDSLVDDIYLSLLNKIKRAQEVGINPSNIIIDPGIGFGKTKQDNYEILEKINEFKTLKCPIMLGVSRKSFLGFKNETNEIKDIYTLATNSKIIDSVNFLRVHNVKLHKKLLDIKIAE